MRYLFEAKLKEMRDKLNFFWFAIAGVVVALLALLHPLTTIQLVSFVLLSAFFFYLAYESFKFENSESEYGHSTGINLHPFISKLIRSAAVAIPAILLFYLIAFVSMTYL